MTQKRVKNPEEGI